MKKEVVHVLEINNLTKKFKKMTAVNDFSFNFDYGVYGILGPNGAGKTTLMRCIVGLYNYTGNIKIDSVSNRKQASIIGYLPQKFGLFPNLTSYEMLKYFALEKEISKDVIDEEIMQCLKIVGLEDKKDKKCASLSGGMIRRLGIAQAILGKPSVIILDEPTAGLDPEERIRFKNIIAGLENTTVLLSTHIVSDVEEVCNRVLVFDKGDLVFNGNIKDITSFATNRIYSLPASQKSEIKGGFTVQSNFEEDGERCIKIIADQPQDDLKSLQATLEDGYICLLRSRK